MSAHDLVPCLYCPRRFQDMKAAHRHMIDKHPRDYAKPEDVIARGKMQAYHQDRVAKARGK